MCLRGFVFRSRSCTTIPRTSGIYDHRGLVCTERVKLLALQSEQLQNSAKRLFGKSKIQNFCGLAPFVIALKRAKTDD